MKKSRTPISVKAGHLEFLKLNAERYDWRDTYHLILTLSWPQFAGLIFGIYVLINLVFAALYWVGGNSIAETTARLIYWMPFSSASRPWPPLAMGTCIRTASYGHIIATLEIIIGMFGMAVVTGLIFVRFSRPTARIQFSKSIDYCVRSMGCPR